MTQTNSLVSVIVPVYNVAAYFDRCMESIVVQSYQNLQILLVNDGSTDDSGALCDRWAARDARIQVIHLPNSGPSAARNRGLDAARGDYILFIDSDDVVAPCMVEELLSTAQKEHADIALCEIAHFFGDEPVEFDVRPTQARLFDREAAVRELWYQRSFLPSSCGRLFAASLFAERRFPEDIAYNEDVDVIYTLFWNSKTIAYIPNAWYGYMHHDNSITTTAFSLRDCAILPVAERMLVFAERNCVSLLPAAQAYAVTAAFRITLNAPADEAQYVPYIEQAKNWLRLYGKRVLRDGETRKKTRIALLLYFYCRPLLRAVYKRQNRWK